MVEIKQGNDKKRDQSIDESLPEEALDLEIQQLDSIMTDEEKQLFELTNAYRAENGSTMLSLDPELTAMAKSHAKDMLKNLYLQHSSHLDLRQADFEEYDFTISAEYILSGQYTTAKKAFDDWLKSPEHLWTPDFKRIGVGVAQSDGDARWVQIFTD